jgi:hypothetical protein
MNSTTTTTTTIIIDTIDIYNQISPTDCGTLRILGIYCLVLFLFSLASNSKLIYIYIKNKTLFSPINTTIFVLAIANLIGTLVTLPVVCVNAFMCRFVVFK